MVKKKKKTKQKSYKKARYMFTIRFLCTVSKKKKKRKQLPSE